MKDYVQQVAELLAKAQRMRPSTTGLALAEEAVRLADAHQDADLGFQARQPLMFIARNLLRGDVQAAAFAWCLGQYDRDPARFACWNIFFMYSEIIGQLANQCDVSRSKLEEMLADFGRRLEQAGYSKRYMHFTEMKIAPDLGDVELAKSASLARGRLPIDEFSPGFEWELGTDVENALSFGQTEQAIELARPFLSGRALEREKTDEICGGLLWPLWQRGQKERAAALCKRCLRSYDPGRLYYWWFGHMMTFPARTGDLGQAVKRYAECQWAMDEFTDPLTRLYFGADALIVLQRLRLAGKEEIAVRLPKDVPVPRTDGGYAVAALQDWLSRQTHELADRFDTRNGTTYWKDIGLNRGG